MKGDKCLLYIWTSVKIHSTGFIVEHIDMIAWWIDGKGGPPLYLGPCGCGRAMYVRVEASSFLVGQSAKRDRRARNEQEQV